MPGTIVRIDSCTTTTLALPAGRETIIAGVWTAGTSEKAVISLVPDGPGARARMYVIILGGGSNVFSFDIVAEQSFPDTSVDIYIRSMLFDSARIDSCGIMRIGKNAQRSHAFFSHHVLLASPGTHAKVTPTLEIETDDVTAGHAVGIGALDPDTLFYCASRGLAPSQATPLIAQGFLLADLIRKREDALRSTLEPEINKQFVSVGTP